MSGQRIGQRVEDLKCYGFAPGETLAADERQQIAQFAEGFEECPFSRVELDALSDTDLVAAAYGAMADYARGQI